VTARLDLDAGRRYRVRRLRRGTCPASTQYGEAAPSVSRLHLPPQSFARDLLDGWRDFAARAWVWLIVVSASLSNMMSSMWLVLAAAWIKGGHWETTLQQHIPPASLSGVSAYDWFGSQLCQPLGLTLAGAAAAGIGMSRTLWIAAAVDLAAVAAILAAPSVRHLQRRGEPQLEHRAQQPVAD
jgi:hypothetical protein